MRTQARLLTGVVLAAAGASCAPVPPAGAPAPAPAREEGACPRITEYVLGTRVEGGFTAGDCSVPVAGVMVRQPTDVYRFTTQSQRDVSFAFDGAGLEHVLVALYGTDGERLREERVGADGFHVLTEQLAPGAYHLVLRTDVQFLEDRRFGAYSLASSTDDAGFHGCLTLGALPPGEVRASWSVADCKREHHAGSYGHVDYYRLSVPSEQDVRLALESPGVESTLVLYRRDGVELARAGGNFQRESALESRLAAGEYVVAAAVAETSERATGDYVLRVR